MVFQARKVTNKDLRDLKKCRLEGYFFPHRALHPIFHGRQAESHVPQKIAHYNDNDPFGHAVSIHASRHAEQFTDRPDVFTPR